MSLIGTWFGIFLRQLCTGLCKALVYTAVSYTFNSPFMVTSTPISVALSSSNRTHTPPTTVGVAW